MNAPAATAETESALLAQQIRTDLSDEAPVGFHYQDHVVRQDEALDRLAAQLQTSDPDVVTEALSRALLAERQGWVSLKLLELMERLNLVGCAQALIAFAENPPDDDDRRMFLAGRACEVLIKLPLNRDTRVKADAACRIPLDRLTGFRLGAEREQKLHRPRRIEWALLVGLMTLALAGLWFTLRMAA